MHKLDTRPPATTRWHLRSLLTLALSLMLVACHSHDSSPPPVDGTAVTAGDQQVVLTWDAAAGVDHYHVYWSTEPEVSLAAESRIDDCTPPFAHSGLENGRTYYYRVVAVSPLGVEGPASVLVAATPQEAVPGVPGPIELLVGDRFLVLYWQAVPRASSYRIYRWTITTAPVLIGETTEVAYEDVVVPDSVKCPKQLPVVTYGYVVTAVGAGGESASSAEVYGTPVSPGGPGWHVEGPGNNLSVPLVFAEGYGLTGLPTADADGLRTLTAEQLAAGITSPYFAAEDIITLTDPLSGTAVDYYLQGQAASTWQADSVSGAELGPQMVETTIDWGDNLTNKAMGWSVESNLRIEATLTQDTLLTDPEGTLPFATMTGYLMRSLFGSQHSEFWGATGASYLSTYRTVYTPHAHLTIEKLVDGPDGKPVINPATSDRIIDPATCTYVDDPATCTYEPDPNSGEPVPVPGSCQQVAVEGSCGTMIDPASLDFLVDHAFDRPIVDAYGNVVGYLPYLDQTVYGNYGADGRGRFGAEVNQSGKLVYGYMWMLKHQANPEQRVGNWRLTFRLDPVATCFNLAPVPQPAAMGEGGGEGETTTEPATVPVEVPLNTRIVAIDSSDQPAPAVAVVSAMHGEGETGETGAAFPAYLVPDPVVPGASMSVLVIKLKLPMGGMEGGM